MSRSLYLEFCGEEFTLSEGEQLTFGRSGDLVVDDNPYMHRVVGRFVLVDGSWRLENHSRRQSIEVCDLTGFSSAVVAPRSSAVLVFGEFNCRFTAGPTRYEIGGALEEFEWATDLLGPNGLDGTETVDWGRVDLNDDQRLLLLAMCEEALLSPNGGQWRAPTNREGALRLGWTVTKFNRKLDHLCEKLERSGVSGLHGDVSFTATHRRRLIVEHALRVPLVVAEDLALLDEARSGAA